MSRPFEMRIEDVIEMIDEAMEEAKKKRRKISEDDLLREIVDEVLLDVPSRGLRAQVRRRLGL